MKFSVVIEKGDEGFYQVDVKDFPDIITHGKTKEETLKNAKEAIECHLEALVDSGSFVDLHHTN